MTAKRMPAILAAQDRDACLCTDLPPRALLTQYPDELHRVSPRVNASENNDAGLLQAAQ